MAINTKLNSGVKLWSEDLADAGYDMNFIGKWHVCENERPSDRGWKNEVWASAVRGDYHGTIWEKFKKIAEKEEKTERQPGEIIRPGYGNLLCYGSREPAGEDHDEKVKNMTVDTILGKTGSSEPWCIYAGFLAPHDPYFPAQKYIDMYNIDDIKLPENYRDTLQDKPYIYRRMRNQIFDQLTEMEAKETIRHYMASCTQLDDSFGKILDALKESGQSENTLVIYISDHGDYCGEHGLFAKGVPAFEGAYHVPALIRWPAGIKNPGRKIEDFVSLTDFAPTLLELAGCTTEDKNFGGKSLIPFMKDMKPETWRDAIFTQFNGVELYYSQRSVITKDFRYTFNGFDRDELYHLSKDPYEMNNLADDPAYEDIKKELCRRMWIFAKEQDDPMINCYVTVGIAPVGPASVFY